MKQHWICVKALFVVFKTHTMGASNFHLGQVVGKKNGFCPVILWYATFADLIIVL
jgi:hypothetical protein